MFNEPSFKIALIISIVAHSSIIIGGTHLNSTSQNKVFKTPRVVYLKQPSVKQKEKQLSKQITLQNNHLISSPAKLLPPPPMNTHILNDKDGLLAKKPDFAKPDIIASAKKVGLESLDTKEINKINSPSYISYYQIIREKIRRCAYQNYMRQDAGEVYLSFVISSNGELNNLKIVVEKSTPNAYLRDIALKSVKEASPYPVFPRELEYPQLSFNVIISFEVE